jgi:hypothetical protein
MSPGPANLDEAFFQLLWVFLSFAAMSMPKKKNIKKQPIK